MRGVLILAAVGNDTRIAGAAVTDLTAPTRGRLQIVGGGGPVLGLNVADEGGEGRHARLAQVVGLRTKGRRGWGGEARHDKQSESCDRSEARAKNTTKSHAKTTHHVC